MEKVVIEVGSTCTKVDGFDGENIIHIDTVAIEFKKHYLEHNAIIEEDIEEVISLVKKYKNKYSKDIIFVCGTSVFRTMKELEKENFLTRFKNETELEFNIITYNFNILFHFLFLYQISINISSRFIAHFNWLF